MTEYQPKYRWTETWPGEGHEDYVGLDGEQVFGRIQLDRTTGTRKGQWMWNIAYIPWAKKPIMPQSGWASTGREASRKVEEHYFKLKLLHGRFAMNNQPIEMIQAEVHGIGGYRNLTSVENLADCLLNQFPEEGRGFDYQTALMTCLDVLENGDSSAADARIAFVAAAREVGVSVLPDDGPDF